MRWTWNILGLLGLLVVLGAACGTGFVMAAAAVSGGGLPGGGDAIAVVYVQGAIMGGEGQGLLAPDGAYSERIVRALKQAGKNPAVKAVVLRVDSPGGGITASDEIYNQVMKLRKEHNKPVVASLGSMAASGGYYVAAPADKILANATTLTGSIGVIVIVPNYQGLLQKVGVEAEVFTSGTFKDESAGLRPLTKEDRDILRSLIEDAYGRFVTVVAEGRGLEQEEVRKLADGRVYSAKQAKDARLIDEFGDLPEAVDLAAKLGGIKGEPKIIEYKGGGLLTGLGGAFLGSLRPKALDALLGSEGPFSIQYVYLGP